MNDPQNHPYHKAFMGRFHNTLRWAQFDSLLETLQADAGSGWYVYAVGEPPPTEPVSSEQFSAFLSEVNELLRKEHDEEFCGIVYTDSFETPGYVKIFDPSNLGVSCGYSDNPPLPGWILSKIPPVDLQSDILLPGNRRRWWRRIFGG
jgi:hypothetical protein